MSDIHVDIIPRDHSYVMGSLDDAEIIEQYFPWLSMSPRPSEAVILYDRDDEDTVQSVEVFF